MKSVCVSGRFGGSCLALEVLCGLRAYFSVGRAFVAKKFLQDRDN